MDYRNLKTLLKAGLEGQAVGEFSAADSNVAALHAILENFGLTAESPMSAIRARKLEMMAVLDEAINELLPARLTNICGDFAEIKTFARDDEVVFSLKNLGKARARMIIVKGARSGIYKAARLDSREFQLPTMVYTVGVYVTLEEILLGKYTLAELFANILEGFEEILYKEVVNALYTSASTLAPSANVQTVSNLTTSAYDVALDKCVRIAKAYGNPLIVGFRSALSHINNAAVVTYPTSITPNVPTADLDEIRGNGMVSMYKGTPILELPNYLTDETNASWMFSEDKVFVLPADAKPVKVALRGDLVTVENQNDTGSQKWNSSKMMGVGIAMANNICVINITDSTNL